MRVRFFAYLRNFTGCAETDVPYEKTVGALARSLCDTYGDKLCEKLFLPGKDEQIGPEVIILINGKHFGRLGGMSASLSPDDRVDLFPVVAGG